MAMEGRDDLTAREREVLELIKRRWRNKEIARHFVIEAPWRPTSTTPSGSSAIGRARNFGMT